MISVREFKKSDADAMVKIQEDNKEYLGDIYTKEDFINNSGYIKFFMAEEGKHVLGYGAFSDLKNGIGMMLSVVVGKKNHGKGVGTKIVKKIKRYAKENKYRKVLFLTRADNKAMIALGLSEGFQKEGILKRHFPRTYDDVVYMSYFIEENY